MSEINLALLIVLPMQLENDELAMDRTNGLVLNVKSTNTVESVLATIMEKLKSAGDGQIETKYTGHKIYPYTGLHGFLPGASHPGYLAPHRTFGEFCKDRDVFVPAVSDKRRHGETVLAALRGIPLYTQRVRLLLPRLTVKVILRFDFCVRLLTSSFDLL